ncbi:MAG TPA: hypothetical protein VJC03_03290, partial [bacterium]|nr:hypothetical protein [bacterium]
RRAGISAGLTTDLAGAVLETRFKKRQFDVNVSLEKMTTELDFYRDMEDLRTAAAKGDAIGWNAALSKIEGYGERFGAIKENLEKLKGASIEIPAGAAPSPGDAFHGAIRERFEGIVLPVLDQAQASTIRTGLGRNVELLEMYTRFRAFELHRGISGEMTESQRTGVVDFVRNVTGREMEFSQASQYIDEYLSGLSKGILTGELGRIRSAYLASGRKVTSEQKNVIGLARQLSGSDMDFAGAYEYLANPGNITAPSKSGFSHIVDFSETALRKSITKGESLENFRRDSEALLTGTGGMELLSRTVQRGLSEQFLNRQPDKQGRDQRVYAWKVDADQALYAAAVARAAMERFSGNHKEGELLQLRCGKGKTEGYVTGLKMAFDMARMSGLDTSQYPVIISVPNDTLLRDLEERVAASGLEYGTIDEHGEYKSGRELYITTFNGVKALDLNIKQQSRESGRLRRIGDRLGLVKHDNLLAKASMRLWDEIDAAYESPDMLRSEGRDVYVKMSRSDRLSYEGAVRGLYMPVMDAVKEYIREDIRRIKGAEYLTTEEEWAEHLGISKNNIFRFINDLSVVTRKGGENSWQFTEMDAIFEQLIAREGLADALRAEVAVRKKANSESWKQAVEAEKGRIEASRNMDLISEYQS